MRFTKCRKLGITLTPSHVISATSPCNNWRQFQEMKVTEVEHILGILSQKWKEDINCSGILLCERMVTEESDSGTSLQL